MDNSASTDIVNQDSDIEATELETLLPLPTTQATEPPTESDLGSHLDEKASWRDAAEVILSAADIIPIPGVGAAIQKVVSLIARFISACLHKMEILAQPFPTVNLPPIPLLCCAFRLDLGCRQA
jgi:hypothetical protein